MPSKRPLRRNIPPSSRSTTSAAATSRRSTPAPPIRRVHLGGSATQSRSAASITSHQPHQPSPHNPDDHAPEEDEEDDSINEIVMAIDVRGRGNVGCAYYVAREEKLYFMEDVALGGPEIVENLKMYVGPTVVLVPSRIDEGTLEVLDPEGRTRGDGESDPFGLPYILETRAAAEFGYESAKNKLANLRLGAEDGPRVTFTVPGDIIGAEDVLDDEYAGTGTVQGQLLRLASWVDMESRLTVGCAGAAISYLQRRRAATYLPGDDHAHAFFRISALEMFTLTDSMFINKDTLLSLQIVESESHPHAHNQGPTKSTSGAKEGLSLFGLFQPLAHTPQGKLLLRKYFLRPSMNLDIINERLKTISIFLRPDNDITLQSIVASLKAIKNIRFVMLSLRKGANGPNKSKGPAQTVWATLRQFAFHTLKIRDAIRELASGERLLICAKVLEHFEARQLASVGRMINDVIDFEESKMQNRAVVLRGVDEELDNKKRFYDGIESLLNRVAGHIAKHIPAGLDASINVIFFPQIGFLVAIALDPETGRGVYEGTADEPWDRVFITENVAYYKSNEMREMDMEIGDIYGLICDREIEIIHDLIESVLEYEDMLTTVSDTCGELDSLLALAQGATLYKLTRPHLSEDNVIKIKSGRHILQELTVPSYVPNDTFLVGGPGSASERSRSETPSSARGRTPQRPPSGPSMLVMTGPNYSGKSVHLKQVALIVYMAHMGSFVPAESATIGLTDKILTRINTRETVSRMQSAFMIDLQQISMALNMATRRSLLVIDEFGKGTDSNDGAGLACGVFQYLLDQGSNSPRVLAATHYHEIFENEFLAPNPSLAFGHMEVSIDDNASEVEDQITYLYTYKPGRSNRSFGTCFATMNGISPEIVRRAEDLITLSARGENLVSACAVMPEEEAAELQEAARIS